jgi:1-acyl-sn-glycerol-3-phosphate acyltransferase
MAEIPERPLRFALAARIVSFAGRLYMRRYLHALYLFDERAPEDESIDVYVANHISRFDGFAIDCVHRRYRARGRLFMIVLRRRFRRFSIFTLAGAFRITPGSVDSGKSLLRLIRRTLRPGDSVAVFPQGEILPQDKTIEDLPTGYLHFAEAPARVRYIPVALAIEMFEHAKPSLFVRVDSPVEVADHGSLKHAVTTAMQRNNERLRALLKERGEQSPSYWEGVRIF